MLFDDLLDLLFEPQDRVLGLDEFLLEDRFLLDEGDVLLVLELEVLSEGAFCVLQLLPESKFLLVALTHVVQLLLLVVSLLYQTLILRSLLVQLLAQLHYPFLLKCLRHSYSSIDILLLNSIVILYFKPFVFIAKEHL